MGAYPGFIGPTNRSASPLADSSRLVNLYVEPNDVASGRAALYSTPGATRYADAVNVTDVGTRALASMNGRTFGIIGTRAYEVFADGTTGGLFLLTPDTFLGQIAFNGIAGGQALFASGMNGFCFDLATNVATAVIPGDAQMVGMLDGYFLAFANGRLRVSDLNDGLIWDPLQVAFRSQSPDTWKAMLVHAPDVFLLGSLSGDVWQDTGATFPLGPRPGATFPYGIAALNSAAVVGDSVLWLAQNQDGAGMLVRARGYVPQPIGSYAFDTAIARYRRTARIDDAEAIAFQWNGHPWYILRFPSANATWGYDLRTGLFFELGHWNAAQNRYDAWHPRAVTYAFGQHLVGDNTGRIYRLDETVGTEENGDPIRRVRVPPSLRAQDGGLLFVDRFELGIQPGVGTSTGQGADPVAMLRVSKDCGQTYGNETSRSIGRSGDTDKRVFWTRLGHSRTYWVPEIVISDPVPVRIVSASVQGRGIANAQNQAA